MRPKYALIPPRHVENSIDSNVFSEETPFFEADAVTRGGGAEGVQRGVLRGIAAAAAAAKHADGVGSINMGFFDLQIVQVTLPLPQTTTEVMHPNV